MFDAKMTFFSLRKALESRCGRLFVYGDKRSFINKLSTILVTIGILLPYIPAKATTCPTSGNNVTIASSCIFDAGTYTFTGTLIINSGVTVTAASNVGGGQVVIESGNITVNGTVSADSTGSARTAGTAPGGSTAGGGHGGAGGDGNLGVGGTSYGSVTAPTTLGSGGGGGSSGGAGGGSIKLSAPSGTITIAGTVTANGQAASGTTTVGGGAGGSVWIDAGTLTGGGTVRANGADQPTGGNFHGGGGGGRVAMYFNTDTSTIVRQAFGGAGGGSQTGRGGAGSVFVDDKDDAFTNGNLTIDNNNGTGTTIASTPQVTTASQTYDTITVRNGAKYVIPNTFSLTLASGGTLTGGGTLQSLITVASGGTFDPGAATFTVTGMDVTNNGTVSTVTNLTLNDSTFTHNGNFPATLTSLTAQSTGNFVFQSLTGLSLATVVVQSSGFLTSDFLTQIPITSLTVNSGGTVTHNGNTTSKTKQIDLLVTTLDLQSGSFILADSKGFSRANGTAPGGSTAGGGHGGHGGDGNVGVGGTSYGSITIPETLGSGGGGGSSGGEGGGAVKITINTGGTLTLNGAVSAAGAAASGNSLVGGGAGGSIWIDADAAGVTFTGTGTVRANGADQPSGGNFHGGGGGGRVAVYHLGSLPGLTLQTFGGAGGGSQTGRGGAGTIFIKSSAATNGDLTVDNNNGTGTTVASSTMTAPSSQSFDNITIKNGAKFIVPSTFNLTLASGGVISGSGAQRPLLTINSGATLTQSSTTFSLSGLDITNNGTVTTFTDLVLASSTFTQAAGATFGAGCNSVTAQSGGALSLAGTSTFFCPTITIQSGGSLTHASNTTTRANVLDISATTIDVQTGGSISVVGKGFTTLNGPGAGANVSSASSGGGYGGRGGDETFGAGALGGAVYGSVTNPDDLGSGAGNQGSNVGFGGGAVKLVVSGTLTVNGTISVNGASSTSGNGGGGSGGSVWMTAGTLAGAGTVSANGGNGTTSGAGGSGGGGGRVAVYYTTDASTIVSTAGKLQAYGGTPGSGGSAFAGGAGSVYVKSAAATNGDLVIDNNNMSAVNTGSFGFTTQVTTLSQTYDNITIRNGAKYLVPNTFTLALAAAGTLSGGGSVRPLLTIGTGGTFTFPGTTFNLNGLDFTNNGSMSTVTDLTVTAATLTNAGLFAAGCNSITIGSAGFFSVSGTSTFSCTTITVQSGGTLTHAQNTTSKTSQLDISATTIDVQTGGSISVVGKGFTTGNGPGAGTNISSAASGGGYGGRGGDETFSTDAAGGAVYGSVTAPTDLGSGAGTAGSGVGHGGGAVKLVVSGTLTVNGSINANGASSTSGNGGGGSGGSVWVQVGTLAGTGTMTSNGGNGTTSGAGGSAGGGGRIAVQYTTDSSTIVSTAGKLQAYGGTPGSGGSAFAGGAGSIYIKAAAATNGDLIVDNNNMSAVNTGSFGFTTQVTTLSQTYDNVTIRNAAKYLIPNTFTLSVASAGAFTGGGAVRPTLTVNSGGTLNLPNATQTVSSIDVTNGGTVGTVTSLTLANSNFTHNGNFSAGVTDITFSAGASTFIHNGTGFDDQNLVVGNSGTFVLQTSAVYSIASLTAQSTGVFESRRSANFTIGIVTVQSGGAVTHTANTTTKTSQLDLTATTIDVQAGGTIDASAKGFQSGSGSGAGDDGVGNCGGGAGYGGNGGSGCSGGNIGPGGVAYGSVGAPTDLGSGGGFGQSLCSASNGGGAIKLAIGGTLTVNGTIKAEGFDAATCNNPGGGSGGSIWVTAGTLAGAGSVSAMGGDGRTSGGGGGGGGGGRVAVYYTTDSSTLISGDKFTAFGGDGKTSDGKDGGAGTVLLKSAAAANGDLIVDNNNIIDAITTPQIAGTNQTYESVTVRKGAAYVIPSATTLAVASGGALTGGGTTRPLITVNSGGTLQMPNASQTLTSLDITNNGTVGVVTALTLATSNFTHNGSFSAGVADISFSAGPSRFIHNGTGFDDQNLVIGNSGTFALQSTAAYSIATLTLQNTGIFESRRTGNFTLGAVTIQSGGTLTHATNTTTKTSQLDFTATSVDVQVGGSINLTGKGFQSGSGPGAGDDGVGNCGGGAGYGGRGGSACSGGNIGPGGVEYGSVAAPTDLGSGGGFGQSLCGLSPGGGALKLTVTGTLTVNGTIAVNGTDHPASCNNPGGGSGGSAWLSVATLAGSGTISADGGDGRTSGGGGGGGGGGRIAAFYTTDSSTLISGDKFTAFGGDGKTTDGKDGGAGTVFLKATAATNGDLIIDNNNIPDSTDTFQIASTSQTYDNLIVRKGAEYVVPSTSSITVANNMTIGSGTQLSRFQVQHTNVTTIGGTLTVASNGVLTHAANTTTETASLNLSAFSVDIQSGGTINVNGVGFASTEGPGAGTDGTTGGGAGHGAAGGNGSSGSAGGSAYDSSTNPTQMGSGGGDDTDVVGQQGGAGGGKVVLNVTHTLTLNGTISANGANGIANEAGGGSGGAININTGNMVGSGPITASGGHGFPLTSSTVGGGGGAGGRTFVGYLATTYSGASTATGGNKGGFGGASPATAGASATPVSQQNDAPVPTTTSIAPDEALLNDPAFTLTVNGTNFVVTSEVRWNGAARTTTFVSPTQLTASIPLTDLETAGAVPVTVLNPAPGGGTSNAQTFTVMGGGGAGAPGGSSADSVPPIVTDVRSLNVTGEEARIEWTTDEAANSKVEYGLTAAYGSQVFEAAFLANHGMNLIGLAPGATYHFRVCSADPGNNLTCSSDATFMTIAGADVTPPVVTGLGAKDITGTSAVIVWSTDEEATSDTDYGKTEGPPYDAMIFDGNLTKAHAVSLQGLSPSTLYHFRIRTKDAAGNVTEAAGTFTTLDDARDVTPPAIKDVLSTPTSTTSARITWTTDEDADSTVEYGTSQRLGTRRTGGAGVKEHVVNLTALRADTAYFFRVRSADAAKNVSVSAIMPFRTPKPAPPQITGVKATPLGDADPTAVTVSWTTDVPADSVVQYGATDALGRTARVSGRRTVHAVTVRNLAAGSSWRYRVASTDAYAQQSVSAIDTFTLPPDVTPPPAVLNFRATGGDGRVTLEWVKPTGRDWRGVLIVRKEGSEPAGPTDGRRVYRSSGTFATDASLVRNGVTYYYGAFSYDAVPNYSPAAFASATPRAACTDTDGDDLMTVGTAAAGALSLSDECVDTAVVRERTCGPNGVVSVERSCEPGFACSFGACVRTGGIRPIGCGDAKCEGGEDAQNCPADCAVPAGPEPETPSEPTAETGAPEGSEQRSADELRLYVGAAGPQLGVSNLGSVNVLPGMIIRVYVPDAAIRKEVARAYLLLDGRRWEMRETQSYEAFVTVPEDVGPYAMTVVLEYADGTADAFGITVTVIANGTVYERKDGAYSPIGGASVTLLVKQGGTFVPWSGGQNPQATDADGGYAFTIGTGAYKLRAEKDGYVAKETLPFNSTAGFLTTDLELVPAAQPLAEAIAEALSDGTVAQKAAAVSRAIGDSARAATAVAVRDVREFADNPIIEQQTEQVAAPAVAAIAAANVVAGAAVTATAVPYAMYLASFVLHPTLLIARRRRKKWGVTYNSLTKLPIDLAIVRLIDAKAGRIVRSAVTDKDGRYFFIVPPGLYKITAIKAGCAFPSVFLKGQKEDVSLVDLYHGEDIEVKEESAITANIPLDPVAAEKTPRKVLLEGIARRLQLALALASVAAMAVAVAITPTKWTVAMFVGNVLVFAAFRRLSVTRKPKSWGIVYDDASGRPVQNAVARIFDSRYNKLLETQVTDARGRYAFLVGHNVYYVTFEKPGYRKQQKGPVNASGEEKRAALAEGLVAVDVRLAKAAPAEPPKTPPPAGGPPPAPPAPTGPAVPTPYSGVESTGPPRDGPPSQGPPQRAGPTGPEAVSGDAAVVSGIPPEQPKPK